MTAHSFISTITPNAARVIHDSEVARLTRAGVLGDPSDLFLPNDEHYPSLTGAYKHPGCETTFTFEGSFDKIVEDVLNILSARIALDNRLKGFWPDGDDPMDDLKVALYEETLGRNPGEILSLATSEHSEALDAVRSDGLNTKDDKLPHRSGFATEIVDAIIRGLDATGGYALKPGSILVEKLRYNRTRPYKHARAF
jgi:hypothetical protein